MAQYAWHISDTRPASYKRALNLVSECKGNLKSLDSTCLRNPLVVQLDSFIKALKEIQAVPGLGSVAKNPPCLHVVKARGVVELHPSQLANPARGIGSYLARFLLNYSEEFGGVWIGYAGLRLLESVGHLNQNDRSGSICVRVALKVLLFVPRLETVIGKVRRVSPRSVAIMIYGIFNGTMRVEDLGDDFTYDAGKYKLGKESRVIQVNTIATFTITSVTLLSKSQWLNLGVKIGASQIN